LQLKLHFLLIRLWWPIQTQREIGGAGWPDGGPYFWRALSSSSRGPSSASGGCICVARRVWFDGLADGCQGEPKGKKRRAPKQPPPNQALPTDMDHRLRWRDCPWRMGGQDVMRLCSTSGQYVTSLRDSSFPVPSSGQTSRGRVRAGND
jgi:hypothetical protein